MSSSSVVPHHAVKLLSFVSGPDEGFNHQILNDLLEQGFEFKQAIQVNGSIRYILTHAGATNTFRSSYDTSLSDLASKFSQLRLALESAGLFGGVIRSSISISESMTLQQATDTYHAIQEASSKLRAQDSVSSVDLNILAAQWCLLKYKTSVLFAQMST